MPTPPYAQLTVAVNGGAPSTGAIQVLANQTVQLGAVSTSGWYQQTWEIYDSPPGFNPGGTWTLEGDGVTWANTNLTPSAFSTGTAWGNFMLRLRVNSNPLAHNQDGSPNAAFAPLLTDETTALYFVSPNLGLRDLGYLEANQFSKLGFVGGIKSNYRALDSGGGGRWATALDFDWTAGGATTFTTDGSVTYNGLQFTKINSANENSRGHMAAGGGTGLSMTPNTGCTFTTSTRSLPGLWLPASQITALSAMSLSTPLRFWVYSPSGIYYAQPDAIVWSVDHNDGTGAVSTAAYVASYEYLLGAPGAGVGIYSGNASGANAGNDQGVSYSSHTNGFVGVLDLPLGISGGIARTYMSPGASYSGGAWPALSSLAANAGTNQIPGNTGTPLQRYLFNASPATFAQGFGFLVGACYSGSVNAAHVINRMKIEYLTGQ